MGTLKTPKVEAVHVVDDDASLRAALNSLFRSVGLVAQSYSSVAELLLGRRDELAGCLVLDVRMPDVGGLDFQAHMRSQGIKLPVVFMTGHGNVSMSVRGMKAGAVDFLEKPFSDEDMLGAVRIAMWIDRVRRIEDEADCDLLRRVQRLSKRERQVMDLVAAGRMNKQIAGDLRLSEIMIKVHRGAAMRKMEARTLAELVRMNARLDVRSKEFLLNSDALTSLQGGQLVQSL